MSNDPPLETAQEAWAQGRLPRNVHLGTESVVVGAHAFRQFRSTKSSALSAGEHCVFDGVHFALGIDAQVLIGDYCCFTNAMLLCELEVRIGSYVMIGFNAAVADSDFHPISPAQRIADAIACSPLGKGQRRPPIVARSVVIEDDVWIGPNATILKGVRIGAGSFIEPGALVTRDVPPRSRVMGNPARVLETL
jgi:acetyltransferase-like isoleucine patch superfamily enzyme